MEVVRKVYGTLDGCARCPKMVSVGITFATAFTRPVVCLLNVGEMQEIATIK
jgi:hypothetical protein